MNRTRLSLFYLAGYLLPTGLGLLIAPQFFLRLLFAQKDYDPAFVEFSGALLVGLGIIVVTIILYGSPVFYRATLIVRLFLWFSILSVYLRQPDTVFLVVLGVLGFGILLTGTFYLLDKRQM